MSRNRVECTVAMNELPSSIEAYLEEAGFSGTEILILRRLMDGEPLTIRQLGAKTGKSTGVLDQAMKKLMKKNIIKRTLINDTPKYSLDSLESVVEWMQDDMEQKREMLLRRHQNFESFVTSLESGSKRPDIEYFEGESGIKQAYIKLLNGPGEIFHYLPVQGKEEEDPLRDFRVQYFRERQNRKMFSRVIAHDTALGRRYQSRDAFEYRKTVLVPEAEYPFTFEKIITGDRIACFDHKAQTACVIRYPELADIERTLFEAIWRQVQVAAATTKEEAEKVMVDTKPEKIALSTEAMSQIREFFLSRTSIVTFGILAVLAFATTYVLSMHNAYVTMDRIKERVKSIAATAALQFEAEDIEQIHDIQDIQKPEYAKIVHHLNRIRRENEGVMFTYILRPTEERGVWRFVADADSLNPFEVKDVDGDGKITDADHLAPPGEVYVENIGENDDPFTLFEAASYDPAIDKWGTHITGSAPILNDQGQPIAIFGADVETSYWNDISQSSFWPLASFIGFFLLFVIMRLGAYNRALFAEIGEILSIRKTVALFLGIAFIASVATLALYISSIRTRTEVAREKIATIAAGASVGFSAEDLNRLNDIADIETPEYAKIVRLLHEVRENNTDIKYAYLLRPNPNSTTFAFIADADAFGKDILAAHDTNGDGVTDDADEIGYPGLPYDVSHIEVLRERLYNSPITARAPYVDKWGFVFSGYAPIRDQNDAVVALVAIDADALSVYMPTAIVFAPFAALTIICVVYLFFASGQASPLRVFLRGMRSKKSIYALLAILICAYWIFFALLYIRQDVVQEETGKRLMAIAATAASQFDGEDLEKLRFARDMKTDEYQKVFKKLNEIRDLNPEIAWIYILRPTQDDDLWEFVADADSNTFLGAFDDFDANGVVSPDEENLWPGRKYFYDWDVFRLSMRQPTYSKFAEVDQWGSYITGAAPIIKNGQAVAILGVDIEYPGPIKGY